MKLQEKMFALVRAWEESGMSKHEFLLGKAVKRAKFDYWLYKYRDMANVMQGCLPERSTSETFKPFVLSEEPETSNAQSVSVEIVTPSGVRITIYH